MDDVGGGSRARAGWWVRTIYALCLIGATYNHWAILWRYGIDWDYGGVPAASAMFWTSLSFLDPTAAVLLFVRPRVGIVATIAIIVVDVIHNLWIMTLRGWSLWAVIRDVPVVTMQVGFMIFVMATARIAWRTSPMPAAGRSSRSCRDRAPPGRRWPC